MTPHERRKLERIVKALDEAQEALHELLHEQAATVERRSQSEFEIEPFLVSLKSMDRVTAEQKLGGLKQHELGTVFVRCGGSSSEKKRPKAWLVEQILWRVFDYDRGLEAIRNKGAGEN